VELGGRYLEVLDRDGDPALPAVVLLHEGLGSVGLWRDFPAQLADATGAHLDRAGRVTVEPDMSLPGHPEIFVIGDLANYIHQDGKPLPGIAPVAIQQGNYVARLIRARLQGTENKLKPFRYRDWGTMATIGRGSAVADLRGVRFSGLLAWLAWLFVHLMYIIEFQNRVLILLQWGWNYFTRNRAARLFTGEDHRLTLPRSSETQRDEIQKVESA